MLAPLVRTASAVARSDGSGRCQHILAQWLQEVYVGRHTCVYGDGKQLTAGLAPLLCRSTVARLLMFHGRLRGPHECLAVLIPS
ncbi:hypothetical protein E2C01_082576 [Portunus trituberculatus]|uniref:Uncharacterized protein n=1 Tax=Portunus trituberculatus TaxID=210409 RepID=A0A5B7J5I1_PORTR|nr:hypothetical protein [Portunus trituberculatus]